MSCYKGKKHFHYTHVITLKLEEISSEKYKNNKYFCTYRKFLLYLLKSKITEPLMKIHYESL
jgi:hypothetical protein